MQRIIRLTFGKVIDQHSAGAFEQAVFRQTFQEFVFKCQEYNPSMQYFSLADMIANNPKANSLHYKTALVISNTVKELKGMVPGVADSLGRENIGFETYEMKILESNPFNSADHRIALYFTTPKLYLHEVIGGFMVVSVADKTINSEEMQLPVFTVQMQPLTGITYYAADETAPYGTEVKDLTPIPAADQSAI